MMHIKTYESFMSKDITLFALEGTKFVEGTINVTYGEYNELRDMGLAKWIKNWWKEGGVYVYDKKDEDKIKFHLELIKSEYYKISGKYNL